MKTYHVHVLLEGTDIEQASCIYDYADDATVALSNGVLHVGFDREAESLKTAIASALDDVSNAGCEAWMASAWKRS